MEKIHFEMCNRAKPVQRVPMTVAHVPNVPPIPIVIILCGAMAKKRVKMTSVLLGLISLARNAYRVHLTAMV